MTKNPRDHRVWTNKEVEQDSAGYLAAQQAFREDQDAAEAQRRLDDDRQRFTEAFTAAGGSAEDAAAAFKASRNEQAAAAARQADQLAVEQARRRIGRRL